MNSVADSSRRRFVAGGLVTVAAVGLAGCGGGGSGTMATASGDGGGIVATTPEVALIKGEASDWDKYVGSTFLIATESGKTVATLASLERGPLDLNRPASLARHQTFIARFEMEARLAPLGDKIYEISHATKGAFSLFLGRPAPGKGIVAAVLN